MEARPGKAAMSDKNIAKHDLQFKLDLESPSLKYVGQLFSNKVLFSVDIPYSILKLWHDMVKNSSDAEGASTSSGRTERTKSYTDLLEKAIPAGMFTFRDSENVRKEIHESLSKICGAVSSLFKKVGALASKDKTQ